MALSNDAAARKDLVSGRPAPGRKIFQHRHYAVIAAAIARAYQKAADDGIEEGEAAFLILDRLATDLANQFARDNDNFNRIRFFQAADATEWGGDDA